MMWFAKQQFVKVSPPLSKTYLQLPCSTPTSLFIYFLPCTLWIFKET